MAASTAVVRSASQYRLPAGAGMAQAYQYLGGGAPVNPAGSAIVSPFTQAAPQTLQPLGVGGEIARFEGTYLFSIPSKRVDVIPIEMVYKRLLEAERQDPTVELPCILSLTTNKLSIYSKATNDLIESLPLLLVSTSAAVMNDMRLRRHTQLVLVGFWPSVKLSDALTVCAMRAHDKTPDHLNLAPGDVHVFNLAIPPQRPVPVAKILVDRLNGARKKLGLQIKSEFIERVRNSEAARDAQAKTMLKAAGDPDFGFGDENEVVKTRNLLAQANYQVYPPGQVIVDPFNMGPVMHPQFQQQFVGGPIGMQMVPYGDQQMMMPAPPPQTPEQRQATEDVMVINLCIDEFEEACRGLRSTAAADAELRRRMQQRGHGQFVAGDGMLIARIQQGGLSDAAFVDIVQKFKFALNLLATHQQDLHNPNHADILRSMWPLFEMLVLTGNRVALAAQVFTPLLSSEAIGMLTSCLTSPQRDFWHSLGDAWVVSRDQARGQEEDYIPAFKSGFRPTFAARTQLLQQQPVEEARAYAPTPPPAPSTNGGDGGGGLVTRAEQQLEEVVEGVQQMRLSKDQAGRGRRQMVHSGMANGVSSPLSGFSPSPSQQRPPISYDTGNDGIDENLRFLDELKAAGSKICVVQQEFAPKTTKELLISKGEYLEVLNDSKQWWLVRNGRGHQGFVPSTILSTLFEAFPNRDYDAQRKGGRPASVVPPAPPPPPAPGSGTTSPPQDRHVPRFAGPNTPSNRRMQEHNSIVNELHSRMEGTWDDSDGRAPNRYQPPHNRVTSPPGGYESSVEPAPQPRYQRRPVSYDAPVVEIPPPPIVLPMPIKVPLTDKSTPEEARKWCLAMHLEPTTLASLNGKSGLDLLMLKDYELNQLVAPEDYKKLSNRLLLVKNKLGWQSMGKKQLQMMLAWRKTQVDSGDQQDGAGADAAGGGSRGSYLANGGRGGNENF